MKPCGQVFLKLKKNFYISCTQCNEEITDYLEFQNHVFEIHLDPLSTEKINIEISNELKENLIELEIKSESLEEAGVLNNNITIDKEEDIKNDIEISDYSILESSVINCIENNDLSKTSNRKNEQCEFCKRFYSAKALEKHRARKKCGECSICFRKYPDLIKHSKFFHPVEERQPIITENISSNFADEFNEKIETDTNENSLFNESNNETQSNESQLNFKDEIFEDDLMYEEFDKHSENEDEIEEKDDEVTCRFCGKIFSEKNFPAHEARRKCGKCPVCFEIVQDIYSHVPNFHKEYSDEKKLKGEYVVKRLPLVGEKTFDKPDKLLRCSYCEKIFKTEPFYKQHVIKHEKFLNTCKICGMSFQYTSGLKKHLRKHSEDKPFKCTQCCAAFNSDGSLKAHISNKHTFGEKVKCTIENCGKVFKSKERKRYHELYAHFNECKHLCVDCGLRFKTSGALNKHSKTVHLKYEDREFTCKFCNLKFAFKYELDPHEMMHLGQKRYLCAFCTKGYGKISHLRRHCLASHGRDID